VGVYSNYLDTLKGFESFSAERKRQLKRISELRESAVLVIAVATENPNSSIDYTDSSWSGQPASLGRLRTPYAAASMFLLIVSQAILLHP